MKHEDPRDRALERLISRMPDSPEPASTACVDADTLAAWVDGALSRDEVAAAEQHAAECGRCRALVAAVIRTLPPQEPATLSWSARTILRWATPLAAAAALVVWIAVGREGSPPPTAVPPPSPQAEVAQRAPDVSADALRPALPQRDAAATPAPKAGPGPAQQKRAKTLEKPPEPKVDALSRVDTLAVPEAQSRAANDARAGGAGGGGRGGGGRAGAMAPATAGAMAPATPPPPPAPPPQAAVSGGVAANPAPPAAPTAAPPMQSARSAFAVRLVDVSSPDGAVRWRGNRGQAIERSDDGGVTWTASALESPVVFNAGTSPSRDVCWLVGPAGTVYLSTDGRTFRRLRFPESVNLTAITASDGRTATVTAADGRRFATTDGGETWTLQETPAAPF